jgi:2-keto-4-pentenoate hydratase/2-oxohepta-3-ene-1,7-dioic acid hydratase in catechol pathway
MSKSLTPSYMLATYQSADGPRAGLVVDEHVFDAAALTHKPAYATVLGILNDWKSAQAALKTAAANAGKSRVKSRPLARTKLLAPVLWPSAIYCAGANYADHVAEMNRANNRPDEPDPHTLGLQSWHFIKASRSLANPGATIKISDYSKMMDWEIGLPPSSAAPPSTSRREGRLRRRLHPRHHLRPRPRPPAPVPDTAIWALGGAQGFDGPARSALDRAGERHHEPQNLGLKLWVNGAIKQDSNTSRMIFTLAEQIAHLSSRLTLHPGDLILTGTPAGVGMGRKEFLQAGDVVKIWIEGIGEISNRMA